MLSLKRASVALLSFFASLPLLAAGPEPWNGIPFSADPKAMLEAAQAVPAGESAAVVLLDEERYSFDDKGRETIQKHLVARVAAESAVDEWSTIDALWAPWIQERPVLQARVIDRDGTVHALDPKALTEAPSPEESLDIFSDNRVLRAPLPAIAVGSVIEELITYTDKNPLVDSGSSGRFYFGRWVPTHQSRLIIEAPASTSITIVNHSDPELQPRKETKDGRQQIVFESGPIKPIEWLEWALPYDQSSRPYIAFSTGGSWQEIARRYSEIVDKAIADSSLQKLVRDAAGSSSKRDEIISKLLSAIQKDVRYAGVEIGESSIIPRTPQEVLGHKYGDCKDKATLLVAMLRQAGIPAHVALLRAGGDPDVNPELPGIGGFNHAIVVVDGPAPLWVDPTDEFARAGELPAMDQGRLALIADPKTTALSLTPVYDSAADRIVETRTFTLAEEGKATVNEVTEASGVSDSSARRFCAQADKKKYREALENYAKGAYNAKSLTNLVTSDPHDLSKPFRLELQIAEAARGTTADGEAAVAIFPVGLTENMPWPLRQGVDDDEDETDATKTPKYHKRQHDFVFPAPFVKEWHYKIVPPPGYAARTLPQNESSKLGTATLTREYSTDAGGAVIAKLTFDSGKRRITASEFEETRKAIKELAKSKAVLIGFEEVGQTKLNAGDIGGALTEFRKLAALHPKEGRHQTEIARALLAGGMGSAAREQVKKAIELEPSYARAYYTQGLILQHDVLSRFLRHGFDLKGSVAALKKAKELDSKDVEFRAEYAKSLEYNADGELYGDGADLAGAIEEYKAIKKDLKDDRLDGEMILALTHAGRFRELRDSANDYQTTRQRDLARVVAAAALDGSAAALREANAVDQTERKEVLEAAAGVLTSIRLYPVAGDLLEQAIQGTANKADERRQLELLRKARKWESMPLPESDPKTIVVRLVSDLVLKHAKAADLYKYFPKGMDKDEKPVDPHDEEDGATRYELMGSAMFALRAELAKDQLPPAVVFDIAQAAIQWQQEGSDDLGYRLRMRVMGQGSNAQPSTQNFYVLKEDGRYVIGGCDALPDFTGWSVLHMANAGKTEAARTWLNWLRDSVQAAGGDDPVDGPPFAKLWSKNKQTATLDDIKTAAAALMIRRGYIAEARPILTAAREKATTDEAKSAIDVSLIGLGIAERNWTVVEPVAKRLADANPDSPAAFNTYVSALVEVGKTKEVIAISNKRLERLPKDRDAIRSLARAASHEGDYASCEKYYKQIIDELTPNAGDYNNRAWNALFLEKDLDHAVEDARQASTLSRGGPSALHTLAALYAETGKSLEGREALLESMDNAGREEPADHDWYVLGRIAENYGALDAAMAAYKKVEKPKSDMNESTYVLAQRRLAAMKK